MRFTTEKSTEKPQEGLDLLTKTNQLPKPLRDAPWVLRPLVNLGLHAFSHSVDILLRNSIKEQHATGQMPSGNRFSSLYLVAEE